MTAAGRPLSWPRILADLDAYGCAVAGAVLSSEECAALAAGYAEDSLFRSRVVMARHGFGRGEYKYFRYPLPKLVAELRETFYANLAPLANRWNEAMRTDLRFPAEHPAFLERCHQAGQAQPTPLVLEYGAGDYNCLHQDVYGDLIFPLQAAFLLSTPGEPLAGREGGPVQTGSPGEQFTGGEFVMTEQRPRMQSRAEVVPLARGDCVIFAVRHRPVQGTRGTYRVNLRHGVSRVKSGRRHTLGIIFHDAL